MNLGRLIRQRRRELRLTQQELAQRLQVSTPRISDLERGKVRNPRRNTLVNLASALEIPVGDLFVQSSS
jgi:transcriptional regulator with XRE-family HTH domain